MSVMDPLQKQSVQQAIRNTLIDTKYLDEPITFGQAVVTHHYLTELQDQKQILNNQYESVQTHQQPSCSIPNHQNEVIIKQAVEFPLQQQTLQQSFGRKKIVTQEAQNIKEVFQWKDVDCQDYKKMLKEQQVQRSPKKWKTEQRDKFRYFVDSPLKEQDDKNEQVNEMKQSKSQEESKQQQSKSVKISESILEEDKSSQRLPKKKKTSIRPRSSYKSKKEKEIENRIKDFNQQTRWLPDSAFTTYYGKPAFHLYGKGNTNPHVGGSVYGYYMLTHNVNPESGEHLPQYQQVYDTALNKGLKKNKGIRVPQLPKKIQDKNMLSKEEIKEVKARNPIMPKDRKIVDSSKNIKIIKPDLQSSQYFSQKKSKRETSDLDQHLDQYNYEQELNSLEYKDHGNSQLQQHHQQSIENKENLQEQENDLNERDDFILHQGQDIGEADIQKDQLKEDNQQSKINESQCQKPWTTPLLCCCPVTHANTQELDPKNYKYLPACWTQRIRPAGRLTHKSENVYNILTQMPMNNYYQETV